MSQSKNSYLRKNYRRQAAERAKGSCRAPVVKKRLPPCEVCARRKMGGTVNEIPFVCRKLAAWMRSNA